MRLNAPRVPDPADAPALRWGILGPGWIADELTTSLRHTKQEVVAVGSRSSERASAFAARHGIDPAHAHGSYEALVADDLVDVVYVASPHSEHLEHALLAIGANKHVLVEKPIAPTAAEAAQIAASNEFCENAALVYDDRAFTVQAHPEFPDEFVEGLIETRAKGVVPDPLLDAARARMGSPLQSASIADRIEIFFKAPRTALRKQGAA